MLTNLWNGLIGSSTHIIIDCITTIMSLVWYIIADVLGTVSSVLLPLISSIGNASGLSSLLTTYTTMINNLVQQTPIPGIFEWITSFFLLPDVFTQGFDEAIGVLIVAIIIRTAFLIWSKLWSGQ